MYVSTCLRISSLPPVDRFLIIDSFVKESLMLKITVRIPFFCIQHILSVRQWVLPLPEIPVANKCRLLTPSKLNCYPAIRPIWSVITGIMLFSTGVENHSAFLIERQVSSAELLSIPFFSITINGSLILLPLL